MFNSRRSVSVVIREQFACFLFCRRQTFSEVHEYVLGAVVTWAGGMWLVADADLMINKGVFPEANPLPGGDQGHDETSVTQAMRLNLWKRIFKFFQALTEEKLLAKLEKEKRSQVGIVRIEISAEA